MKPCGAPTPEGPGGRGDPEGLSQKVCDSPKDGLKWENYRTDKKWSTERCFLDLAIQRPSVGLPWGSSG